MEFPRDRDCGLRLKLGSSELRLVLGDLTEHACDAMVNAANAELEPGGGVSGAIHRKGGARIREECRKIFRAKGTISPGEAVATTAGNLPARYVIHAVGPVWRGGHAQEAQVLRNCYRSSMRIADELDLRSVAFPAISTGIYGYPLEEAARIAIPALIDCLSQRQHVVEVSLVLFDRAAFDVFAAVLAEQKGDAGRPSTIAIDVDG
jgi:O-acetyl-ADP-ribose deacetylase